MLSILASALVALAVSVGAQFTGLVGTALYGASTFIVQQGGTGATSFTAGNLLYGSGTSPVQTVATTSAECSGAASCDPFVVIGSSPITISATGGSGSSGLASTTPWTVGQVAAVASNSAVYSVGTSTPTVSAPLQYSGTLGRFVGGSSGAFSITQAGAGTDGYLSSTDWNTFNNKQAAGNYITALTGDVTASGPGSVAATLATVNSNVGTFTNSTITVNAKGLITAASSGAAPESPLTFTWPLVRSTNTISFDGLSTSSPAVIGNLPYFTGVNTFGNVATGTITCSSGASCGAGSYVIGANLTITGSGVDSIAGTANQITASASTGDVTLSLPSHVIFPSSYQAAMGTTTNATSTNLTVSNNTILSLMTSALLLTGSDGLVAEYAGTSCTNQFVRSISALGVATCATVSAGDVSLADLTATNSTLTFSGTYNGSTARTIGINLGNSNAWTALQTFTNATSTLFTSENNTWLARTGGSVGIASTTPWSRLSIGSGNASSSITVAEYKYGATGNMATSTTANIDCRTANQHAWPIGTSATTLTLIGLTPGQSCRVVIQNPGGGTAGGVTWAVQSGAILSWAGGTTPTRTTTANKYDVYSFIVTMGSSTMNVLGAQSANF